MYRLEGVDYRVPRSRRTPGDYASIRAARSDNSTSPFRVYQYLDQAPSEPVPASSPHAHPVVDQALASRSAYFAAKQDALFELELYLVISTRAGPPDRRRRRGSRPG